jgi:hypothetical protein
MSIAPVEAATLVIEFAVATHSAPPSATVMPGGAVVERIVLVPGSMRARWPRQDVQTAPAAMPKFPLQPASLASVFPPLSARRNVAPRFGTSTESEPAAIAISEGPFATPPSGAGGSR